MTTRILVLFFGFWFGSASIAAAVVDVALLPSASSVPPDTDVWVTLRVTQAGSLFNGYSTLIQFDPAKLVFVPETTQEGAYMLGACGNTFHSYTAQPNQISIQHQLFCPGTSLAGPGDLYVLHFRSLASGTTQVTFSELRFYNVGHPVATGTVTSATIQVTGPTDIGDGIEASWRRVDATPNPFVERTTIRCRTDAPGIALITIHDVRGRRVRVLEARPDAHGNAATTWDGRDDTNRRVAAGSYVATIATPRGVQTHRLVLAR